MVIVGSWRRSRSWSRSVSSTDYSLIASLVHRDNFLGTEFVADARAGGLGNEPMLRRIPQQHHAALRHFVKRIRRMQKSADAMLDHFGKAADARRDDGHFAGHRFERRQSKALLRRRQQEEASNRQQRHHFL